MSDDNRRVWAFGRREQQVVIQSGVLVSPGPPPSAPPPTPSGAGVTAPWPTPKAGVSGGVVSGETGWAGSAAVTSSGHWTGGGSLHDARTVALRAPVLPPGCAPVPQGRQAPLPPPRQAALTSPPLARGPSVPSPHGPATPGRSPQPTPRVQAAPDARMRQVHRRSEVVDA